MKLKIIILLGSLLFLTLDLAHSDQGKARSKFYDKVIGGSQELEHHDLEAKHQQQFQVPNGN